MSKTRTIKDVVLAAFTKFARSNNKYPTLLDMGAAGFTRETIRHHFGSLANLRDVAREKFPEAVSGIVDETSFTEERHADVLKAIKTHKRFVVTTAVVGCEAHAKFLASIDTFCKKEKAALLVLPSADPASKAGWTLDPAFKDRHLVFKDVALNSKLSISAMKLSAKHIDPITGLARIGQRNGSFILASPKQRLKFAAISNSKMPHALMTTGAITIPNYDSAKYMSDRTATIADHDHIIGALVVEIQSDKRYHFRQVQADADGCFIDLSTKYTPSGTKFVRAAGLSLGDWHSGETDPGAKQAWKEIAKLTKPKELFIHDGFNGLSINHHEEHNHILKAKRAATDNLSLEKELRVLGRDLAELEGWLTEDGRVVMVKSNHDEFLDRYLAEARYVDQPHNHLISLKLAIAMIEGKDPLKYGVELASGFQSSKTRWLSRDEDHKICKIECGAHGDKGANGGPGTMSSIELAYSAAVVGHSHSPEILRGVYRVGTSSLLKLGYNKGPSSWLHSSCIIYDNGSRQLINYIDGDWRLG